MRAYRCAQAIDHIDRQRANRPWRTPHDTCGYSPPSQGTWVPIPGAGAGPAGLLPRDRGWKEKRGNCAEQPRRQDSAFAGCPRPQRASPRHPILRGEQTLQLVTCSPKTRGSSLIIRKQQTNGNPGTATKHLSSILQNCQSGKTRG